MLSASVSLPHLVNTAAFYLRESRCGVMRFNLGPHHTTSGNHLLRNKCVAVSSSSFVTGHNFQFECCTCAKVSLSIILKTATPT